MARVLDLRDVLELVVNDFQNGTLTQQQLVGKQQQAVLHIGFELGDELEMVVVEQLLKQRLRQRAFVAKQLAPQIFDQLGDRGAVIDVACCQTTRQQFAAIIDHQMQLEAVEPAHRIAAPRGVSAGYELGLSAFW